MSRLDPCCSNRGLDLASCPDPDWQVAAAANPHHVARSRPRSRARLSIPYRCSPIDFVAYDQAVATRSRLVARTPCPRRLRSTSALVRQRFCAMPAPPDRAGCSRAQMRRGGAR